MNAKWAERRERFRRYGFFGIATLFLAVLAFQLLAIGPTEDPDPDGYVSYARALQAELVLPEHRRLPGYPAVIAVVDGFSSAPIAVDVFWFHFAMIVVMAAASTYLIQSQFGDAVALVYLAILSINSFFAYSAILLLADLLHVYMMVALAWIGWLAMCHRGARRYALVVVFALCVFLTTLVHPSTAMRLYIFLLVGLGGLLLYRWQGWRDLTPATFRLAASGCILLGLASFAGSTMARAAFDGPQNMETFSQDAWLSGTRNFLDGWLAYRMLTCLPATGESPALDAAIAQVNEDVSRRQGYPAWRVVPPGLAPEFLELAARMKVPVDHWQGRLAKNPFGLVPCASGEALSKYHTIARNLTPFTPFGTDKKWMTVSFPPDTGTPRDVLFWSTGINLIDVLPADADVADVANWAVIEVLRIALVLALIGWGLVLLDRRFPLAGFVVGMGTLAWLGFLSIALPLEARYLLPQMPVLYLAQALALVWVAGRLRSRLAGP